MTLDDFLSRLEGVKRQSGGYIAKCPAHEDRHQSMKVDDGGDRVLVRCHAGCTMEQVCAALRIEPRELFYEERKKGDPDAVYEYVDEQGELLYQVVRLPGKQFRQRHPGAGGEWVWNMQGVRRVLYQLPEVLVAVGNRWIFVCEGEKDVEAIRAAGGIATCNVGGAGKWRDEYTETLRGAHVRIVADKDAPGQRHAETVKEALEGVAAFVSIVHPREGKDAYDHLKAGHRLDEFETEPAQAEITDGLVMQRGDTVQTVDVEWLPQMENLLAYGALGVLMGMPDVNKSTFTCLVAAHVTHEDQDAVFVVSGEDSPGRMKPRLEAAGARVERVHFCTMRRDGFDTAITFPEDINELERACAELKARLIVIDPITSHYGHDIDNMNDASVRRALAPLARMAERLDACVLMVIHLNKSRSSSPLLRAGGSIGIPGIARQGLLMAPHPDVLDGDLRVVASFKNNWGAKPKSRVYRVTSTLVPSGNEPVPKLEAFGHTWHSPRHLLRDIEDRRPPQATNQEGRE